VLSFQHTDYNKKINKRKKKINERRDISVNSFIKEKKRKEAEYKFLNYIA
jgi:hypothetical protein